MPGPERALLATPDRPLSALRSTRRGDSKGAPKAMFGVLAEVEQTSRIRLGDEVRVLA
jgi:hypothetical protein